MSDLDNIKIKDSTKWKGNSFFSVNLRVFSNSKEMALFCKRAQALTTLKTTAYFELAFVYFPTKDILEIMCLIDEIKNLDKAKEIFKGLGSYERCN